MKTIALLLAVAATASAQRPLMTPDLANSAESAWVRKPVLTRRLLDDMSDSSRWRFSGTGRLTFPSERRRDDMRVLRVDMQMFVDTTAPTRNRLSTINLQRLFGGEDWRAYNRISLWIRPDFAGIPILPLEFVLHNDGVEKVPDRYNREGVHFVSLANGWQHVVWEIEPLARDRVTMLEIGYWVNKMLAAPGDRVGFEIGRIELQQVRPDHHTGWSVSPGKIAFSNRAIRLDSRRPRSPT